LPLPRFEKLPDDKRRAILDAAAEEFAEHGFDGASFNRIILTAGISKGAMYYYFADKSDAYGAVLDDVMERVLEAVADLARPTSAEAYWSTLEMGLARLNSAFFADARLAALARGMYASAGADSTYQRLLAQSAAWVEELVNLGRELGAVREDVPSDLLAAMATGMLVAADRWFVEAAERVPLEELAPLSTKMLEMLRDISSPR
jgi:AcrR family transcriptional regulator